MSSPTHGSAEPAVLPRLREHARAALSRTYPRYSGFIVLAAMETTTGEYFGGANVEVANYSLTKHAEEAAVMSAIAAGADLSGGPWIRTVYVVGGAPCGSCRQFLWEFAVPEARVFIDAPFGRVKRECALAELLPEAFGPADLDVDMRPGTPPEGIP